MEKSASAFSAMEASARSGSTSGMNAKKGTVPENAGRVKKERGGMTVGTGFFSPKPAPDKNAIPCI